MKKIEMGKKAKAYALAAGVLVFMVGSYKAGTFAVNEANRKMDNWAIGRVQQRSLISTPEGQALVKEVPVIKAAEVDKQITSAIENSLK